MNNTKMKKIIGDIKGDQNFKKNGKKVSDLFL